MNAADHTVFLQRRAGSATTYPVLRADMSEVLASGGQYESVRVPGPVSLEYELHRRQKDLAYLRRDKQRLHGVERSVYAASSENLPESYYHAHRGPGSARRWMY